MKLLTHNMVCSSCLKGVTSGYPMKIVAKEIRVHSRPFNKESLIKFIPRLNWDVFYKATQEIGHPNIPKEIPPNHESNDEFLTSVHHHLLELDIFEGELVCPDTNKRFIIRNGIANISTKEEDGGGV